ncbi:TetR/AcrR family transcriptional regulator [Pseudoduganella sp. SL102]|uniref:TetR family transcriptional regulator n=1 Tax=Pseudoduganella albidiflava TaxID=321983 RepID=A0A411WUV2_9BURK|nr:MULTISPECIES: TetR/AcrR family transcriptional regulator [Pseudoduganella]QBI00402.1 TetR/AcrR family transcriptional regulator [Pseudoduganella albidiflava]WBS01545.1 TetR/AcrR family transcriptional regulator [Pseudoduganella sp. SL102]GGY53654.1 TetR family transcriptional regulator [Pseudoduganella albidiflava]
MSTTEKRHHDPEKARHRRRQVLDAAAACFGRSGFHGASMAEISKAAGMSAGHIYNYFDSKDAIIAAFVEENVERVSALMRGFELKEDPLQALLDEVPRSVRDDLDPQTWILPLEITAEASRNPKIAAVARDADRRTRELFRVILKVGRQRHGLSVEDAVLDGRMNAIIAMFQGLPVRAVHNPDMDPDVLTESFRLALRALLFT